MLDLTPASDLPASLHADIEEISLWDAQYTLMREEVDLNDTPDRALYDLRMTRNTFAAKTALAWMQAHKPDVVIVPNGLILEMGVVFRVARHLGIDAVTYEFNDQREQIWLAQNSSIMRQDTDYLVEARCSLPMTDEMYERVADLENARRGARVWGKSKRLWQYVSSQGALETKKTRLGRPPRGDARRQCTRRQPDPGTRHLRRLHDRMDHEDRAIFCQTN
jgi:hypothetical protein